MRIWTVEKWSSLVTSLGEVVEAERTASLEFRIFGRTAAEVSSGFHLIRMSQARKEKGKGVIASRFVVQPPNN